jgi:hypothetical protein
MPYRSLDEDSGEASCLDTVNTSSLVVKDLLYCASKKCMCKGVSKFELWRTFSPRNVSCGEK